MPLLDPAYNYTTLVFNPAGANGSTSFADASALAPGALSTSGTIAISTAVTRAGAPSVACTGAGYLVKPFTAGMGLGTALPWLAQVWFYPTTIDSTDRYVFRQPAGSGQYGISVAVNSTNGVRMILEGFGGISSTISNLGWGGATANAWNLVQFGRYGSSFVLGLNSNLTLSTGSNSTAAAPTTDYRLGENFLGYLSSARVWVGVGGQYNWYAPVESLFPTSRAPLAPLLPGQPRRLGLRATPPVGKTGLRQRLQTRFAQRLTPGQAAIAGEVDVFTTPAEARIVRVYDRLSGALVREVVTGADGLYSIPGLSDRRRYYVVALDNQPGGYNAAIADYVLPT